MKELIMENFEAAIAPYVKAKIISQDNPGVVKYELVTFSKSSKHQVGHEKRVYTSMPMGKIPKPVITPDGRFMSVKDASEFYKVTTAAIFARIAASQKKKDKRYYFEI